MRTPRPSSAKCAISAVLILLGSSTAAFATPAASKSDSTKPTGTKAEPGQEQPASPATSSAAAQESSVSTPPKLADEIPTEPPPTVEPAKQAAETQPAPDPASITEVGVQRLPDSAYPAPVTRGLQYGSLWLTFHGLQWPYMPASGNGSRFVVGLSGWGWVDTSYEKFAPWGNNPNIGQDKIAYWVQQARLVLRVTPTYSLGNGWFIQGQGEFVANENQSINRADPGGIPDIDDLWLRIGQWNKWDFTIGRYEGWEIFHLGMGLDLNTFERDGALGPGDVYKPEFYGVTDMQYRPTSAAGNAAFHYYPLPYLRFELLSTVGSISGYPVIGVRPVAIFDLGWLKLKAGTEYEKRISQSPTNDQTNVTKKGIGGAIQFVFEPHIEFGLNAAQGTVWSIDSKNELDLKASLTRTSFGGFVNVSNGSRKYPLIFGAGSVYTHRVDQNRLHSSSVDDFWQLQNFIAVQYVAFNQMYIKLVAGYARGHWDTDEPLTYDDEVYSVRLRFSFYY
jgi:hypothetical protein